MSDSGRPGRFAIASSRVVLPDAIVPAVVVINGESIESIGQEAPPGVPVQDIGDLVLMPGLVDVHVHCNEPGRTDWEGFATATRAAAAGGITTLVDMPLNSSPVTTTLGAFEAKLRATEGKLHTDVAFHCGVVPGNASDLPNLIRAGIVGAKAFMIHSGIDDFPAADEATLREAMKLLASAGIPLLAHAEVSGDAAVVDDPRVYRQYMRSRPDAWEIRAIDMLIRLCEETGCAVHVVHLATAGAVDRLRAARRRGLPITVETCPHYLFFTAEEISDGRTDFKCAPPIRERRNADALWSALSEGVIDVIASDHSPCPPEMKLPAEGDFMRAWGGIASLQLLLPAFWTEARDRGFGLRRVSNLLSAAPARLIGLADNIGIIEPGKLANLVEWDPEAEWTVHGADLQHRHKLTPYEGRKLRGRIRRTYLRGSTIFDDGHFSEAAGRALLKGASANV